MEVAYQNEKKGDVVGAQHHYEFAKKVAAESALVQPKSSHLGPTGDNVSSWRMDIEKWAKLSDDRYARSEVIVILCTCGKKTPPPCILLALL